MRVPPEEPLNAHSEFARGQLGVMGGWRPTAGNSSRTSSKQSLVTSSSTP